MDDFIAALIRVGIPLFIFIFSAGLKNNKKNDDKKKNTTPQKPKQEKNKSEKGDVFGDLSKKIQKELDNFEKYVDNAGGGNKNKGNTNQKQNTSYSTPNQNKTGSQNVKKQDNKPVTQKASTQTSYKYDGEGDPTFYERRDKMNKEQNEEAVIQSHIFDNDVFELRKAMIYSEILQKPLSLRK